MKVLIDECGDSGFKFDHGSSDFFTISMVIFEDDDEYFSCDTRISLLRKELGFSGDHEFHHCFSSKKIREKFFQTISPYNFFYYSFVLNKRKLTSDSFKNKQTFYKYTASLLFENAKDKLYDAEVFIDGSGDTSFRQSLSKYLKRKMNSDRRCIKSVKMVASHKMNLLQVADFVASGTGREVLGKDSSISIISHRKISTQIWPK